MDSDIFQPVSVIDLDAIAQAKSFRLRLPPEWSVDLIESCDESLSILVTPSPDARAVDYVLSLTACGVTIAAVDGDRLVTVARDLLPAHAVEVLGRCAGMRSSEWRRSA